MYDYIIPESVKQPPEKELKKVDNLLICSILYCRHNITIPLANKVADD